MKLDYELIISKLYKQLTLLLENDKSDNWFYIPGVDCVLEEELRINIERQEKVSEVNTSLKAFMASLQWSDIDWGSYILPGSCAVTTALHVGLPNLYRLLYFQSTTLLDLKTSRLGEIGMAQSR